MYGHHSHIGCLSGEVKRIGYGLSGCVTCVSQGLKGYVSLSCSCKQESEIIWLLQNTTLLKNSTLLKNTNDNF